MMLTCATYSGEEAASMGLVNRRVPDAELDLAVADLCHTLQENSSFVQRGYKQLSRFLSRPKSR